MSNVLFSNQGITRVPHSKMLKSEMADYADRTIDIVREFAPDLAQISPVFDLLLAKKPDIEALRLIYGIDTERMKLANLKGKLMLKVSALKLKVRLLKRSNTELDLHVVENAIKSYLRYLDKSRNDKQLIQRVAGFIEFASTNEEMGHALSEFGLNNELMAIEEAHDAYINATANRVKLLSKRSKVSTRVIVKGVFGAITNLFKSIEVAHLVSLSSPANAGQEGEEGAVVLNYTPLINELSQLSQMYNRSIAIRRANNLRNAASGKDGQTGTEVEVDTENAPDTAPEGNTPADAPADAQSTNYAATSNNTPNQPLNEEVDQDAIEDWHDADVDEQQ